MQAETVVALSSGALPAGIAVVRLSGPACRAALEALAGGVPQPRRAVLRRIRDASGETIDRGLVLFFEAPGTVTGEDLAEFHLHGGRAVVSACLEALTALPGVRLAEAGEFTRRAFENGRIDLTEAEGLADLILAETEAQRRQAVAQSGGALRSLYEGWMTRLVRIRALLEASFDFADEGDVGDDVASAVRPGVETLIADMRAHLAEARRGEILRNGFRVAIVGPPNAGKSSLLNALAAREVSIVTNIPGTTRDVVEATLDLGGFAVRLADTAGLRDTVDPVEAIGVERAHAAAAEADLVLFLAETEDAWANVIHVKQHASIDGRAVADAVPFLRVLTKTDLHGNPNVRFGNETFDIAISTATGEGLSALVARLTALAAAAAGDPSGAIPARTRHREIVAAALRLLEGIPASDHPPEFVAEMLRQASDRLGGLTGRVGVEDLLDVIFSAFCIGK